MTKLILGVLTLALFLELFLRFLGFGYPLLYKPSKAGYEFVPNQTVTRIGKTTHINNLGTRGPNINPEAANGISRLLVVGDSVANGGAQINDDQSWPMILEHLLNKNNQRFEVINSSVSGWAVQNESAWITAHGTFGAKMIILEINEKDLDQAFVSSDILDKNISFPSRNPPSAISEVIFRYILPRFGFSANSADPGSTDGSFQGQTVTAVFRSIDQIASVAKQQRAKLIILYWDLRNDAASDAIPTRERLFRYASEHGIDILRPELRQKPGYAKFFRDEIHPNELGNIEIANAISKSPSLSLGF